MELPKSVEIAAFESINLCNGSGYPRDYHTKYGEEYYRGELIRDSGKYYSNTTRRKFYSSFERNKKHVCPGHYAGYRFIISKFSRPGDIILDPFGGTGTTGVEAFLQGRNAILFEVEFSDIIEANIKNLSQFAYKVDELYNNVPSVKHFSGDARVIVTTPSFSDMREKVSLIVTGPPYPGRSDAPQRGSEPIDYDRSLPNFAVLDGDAYEVAMKSFLQSLSTCLKIGGHVAFIVKDLVRDKRSFLLHKLYSDMLLELGTFSIDSIYVHKHWPPTFFINTYNKINPDAEPVPRYQTMIVLRRNQ